MVLSAVTVGPVGGADNQFADDGASPVPELPSERPFGGADDSALPAFFGANNWEQIDCQTGMSMTIAVLTLILPVNTGCGAKPKHCPGPGTKPRWCNSCT